MTEKVKKRKRERNRDKKEKFRQTDRQKGEREREREREKQKRKGRKRKKEGQKESERERERERKRDREKDSWIEEIELQRKKCRNFTHKPCLIQYTEGNGERRQDRLMHDYSTISTPIFQCQNGFGHLREEDYNERRERRLKFEFDQ